MKIGQSPIQIHLSTMLLLTLVAAVILWGNIAPQKIIDQDFPGAHAAIVTKARGWPFIFKKWVTDYENDGSLTVFIDYKALLLDVVVAIVLFFLVATCSEFAIRRSQKASR